MVPHPSFAQEAYVTRIGQGDIPSFFSLMIRDELSDEFWLEIREIQEGIMVYKCYGGGRCEPLVDEVVTLEELRSALVKHNVTYTLVALVGLVILVLLAKQAGLVGGVGVAGVAVSTGGGVSGGLLGTLIVGPASGGIMGAVLAGTWHSARMFSYVTRVRVAGAKLSWIDKVYRIPLEIVGGIAFGSFVGHVLGVGADKLKSGRQLPAGYAIADGSHLRKLLSDKTNLYTFDLYRLEVELARLVNVIVENRQE